MVTAIEVIEHTLDPVSEPRAMRRLLRTGGLLFPTRDRCSPARALAAVAERRVRLTHHPVGWAR